MQIETSSDRAAAIVFPRPFPSQNRRLEKRHPVGYNGVTSPTVQHQNVTTVTLQRYRTTAKYINMLRAKAVCGVLNFEYEMSDGTINGLLKLSIENFLLLQRNSGL